MACVSDPAVCAGTWTQLRDAQPQAVASAAAVPAAAAALAVATAQAEAAAAPAATPAVAPGRTCAKDEILVTGLLDAHTGVGKDPKDARAVYEQIAKDDPGKLRFVMADQAYAPTFYEMAWLENHGEIKEENIKPQVDTSSSRTERS